MKQKMILMVVLLILLAGCAKLIEPGSPPGPIGAAVTPIGLGQPTPLPSPTAPPAPSIESPLPTPFQSPLAVPEFVSPVATPQS